MSDPTPNRRHSAPLIPTTTLAGHPARLVTIGEGHGRGFCSPAQHGVVSPRGSARPAGAQTRPLRSIAPTGIATQCSSERLHVAIEEIDPDRPRITWLTRRNKLGWDCPDALYANAVVNDRATYRITGKRRSVHFLGLQVMAGIRSLHNTHADEWAIAPDGSFEIIASPAARAQNGASAAPALDPARAGETRLDAKFFYDWDAEEPRALGSTHQRGGRGGRRVLTPASSRAPPTRRTTSRQRRALAGQRARAARRTCPRFPRRPSARGEARRSIRPRAPATTAWLPTRRYWSK